MPLKDMGKLVVARTATNPIAWSLYRWCGRFSNALGQIYGHARFTREIGERDEHLRRLTRELFPEDAIVVSGPFAGLKYLPQSHGSALLPKLLGSYESELHPVLAELAVNEYTTIIDIGCAEGYYAVGLGLKFPKASIYAFDIDMRARQLCRELAETNGVAERLHIAGFCDAETLRSIPLGRKALIISDCEGYEGSLFTSQIASLLRGHDLIVETHDFIDIEISSRLGDIFAPTHRVRSIKSIDDIEKAHTYRYPQLENYALPTRRLIVAERRPAIMEWLVMTPKESGRS